MVAAPVDCVIGLGANLGERRRTLAQGAASCAGLGEVLDASSLYETLPVGGPEGQPLYLNAALLVRIELAPEALLDALQELEREAGRRPAERWAPRVLDLDILWIAGRRVSNDRLVVPHPRLHQRGFALVPLLEVAPDAREPGTERPYSHVADALGSAGVVRVARPEAWIPAHLTVRRLVGRPASRY